MNLKLFWRLVGFGKNVEQEEKEKKVSDQVEEGCGCWVWAFCFRNHYGSVSLLTFSFAKFCRMTISDDFEGHVGITVLNEEFSQGLGCQVWHLGSSSPPCTTLNAHTNKDEFVGLR